MDPNCPSSPPAPIPSAADRFDAIYASNQAQGPTVRRIRREVRGEEYPEEVAPFSSVTRSELRRLARDLGVGSGGRIVDLACGEGGVALWLARETGAHATGVDISPVAVRNARERIAAFGVEGRADFLAGDFADTGLPARSFDGAVSIDALWLASDKRAVLREVARLLRPGAAFVFTTWDFGVTPPEGPQVADHRPLLEEAGFLVETYERLADWEREFRATVERYHALRHELAAEIGADRADQVLAHHDRRLALLPHWQRIYVVARTQAED